MTNEEIKIKVAESLGWTHVQPIRYHGIKIVGVPPDAREPDLNFPTSDPDIWCAPVPNYPESLDACAEFRKTLTDTEKERYVWWLNHLHPSADIHYSELQKDVRREVFDLIDVKPIEHCVAYLKMKELIP